VIRYYRLVDLFVFPRRRVRLTDLVTPLKPLEAMAQSKPVTASDVGGHRELLQHGETGYLFPPDDALALAECLRTLIINPIVREWWKTVDGSSRKIVAGMPLLRAMRRFTRRCFPEKRCRWGPAINRVSNSQLRLQQAT
jgi:glycosyltransferase involved in cell wall biosynthesis